MWNMNEKESGHVLADFTVQCERSEDKSSTEEGTIDTLQGIQGFGGQTKGLLDDWWMDRQVKDWMAD